MLISHGVRNLITDRVRRLLGMPAHIQAAALPWRETAEGIEVMLITSRGTGRWVLPKGWPEDGEQLARAAAREASEEAGLEGAIAAAAVGRYYYDKVLRSGRTRRCQVHVFPLKVGRAAENWPEQGQRERKWMTPGEASRKVQEPDLAELIASFGRKPQDIAA